VNLSRHRRRWLSAGLLFALLVMQWATAVHACPVAHSAAPVAVMPAMPDCDMQAMDAGHLQQCKAHCERPSQALNSAQGADLDVQPLALAIVDWGLARHAMPVASQLASIARCGAAPPGSRPLYITLRVLRN
jgi:hypothetical protein